MENFDYQNILKNEFERRAKINPRYSMRSFASSLEISSSALSEILSGKRKISVKKAEKLLPHLRLSLIDQKRFLNSVKSTKAQYQRKNSLEELDLEYHQLKEDTFEVMSDWYYYAILNLVKVDKIKSDEKIIATRLGISPSLAKIALERLFRLNLLIEEKGVLVRTNEKLKVTDDIPSSSLRNYHRQVLEKAIQSLEKDPVEERDVTSIAMAIDPANLEKAKKKIKKFRLELSDFLEKGKPARVYNLNIQLIPMDIKESKK